MPYAYDHAFAAPNKTKWESADAAANTSTNYTITNNGQFHGTLGANESDWVRVYLEAGKTYVLSALGRDGRSEGIDDTILKLRDSSGNQIAYNNDVSSTNEFSQIKYTVQTSGYYYLDVSAAGGETGKYTVTVADDWFSPRQAAWQLTHFGWGVATPLAHDVKTGGTITINIDDLNADGKKLALWALESWSDATGLKFVRTSGTADINFTDDNSGAYGGPSSYKSYSGEIVRSIVNISESWIENYGSTIDSYGFQTYVHEIGHALGLYHSGAYNGSANYGKDATFANDSHLMTVMSYFDPTENPAVKGEKSNFISPMVADITATNSLYGSSQSTNLGYTKYFVKSNVDGFMGDVFGAIFDGKKAPAGMYNGGPLAFTITDSGGWDILNFTGLKEAVQIDMRAGFQSSVPNSDITFMIAIGTHIEGASGGAGDDRIVVNSLDNWIKGNRGTDTAVFETSADNAVFKLFANGVVAVKSNLGFDKLKGIETFVFNDSEYSLSDIRKIAKLNEISGSSVHENLNGKSGTDVIVGKGGNDTINGFDGSDALYGNGGADLLYGGNGNDILRGHAGDDRLLGGAQHDILYGDRGHDKLWAGPGNDKLLGGDGRDSLNGQDGNDRLWGGSGNDILTGGSGEDVIEGGSGADLMWGGADSDTFIFTARNLGGKDIIKDFRDGDTIRVIGMNGTSDVAKFRAVDKIQTSLGTELDINGQTVLLEGINIGEVTVDDFVFI